MLRRSFLKAIAPLLALGSLVPGRSKARAAGPSFPVAEDRHGGVEVVVSPFEFTETHRIAHERLAADYRRTLAELTACRNDRPFKGFAPGECLFAGASGSRTPSGEWVLTFHFAGRHGGHPFAEPGDFSRLGIGA